MGFGGRVHSGKSECGRQGGGDAREQCDLAGDEHHSDPKGSSSSHIAGRTLSHLEPKELAGLCSLY